MVSSCRYNQNLVSPDYSFENCPFPDIVCIPDFFVYPAGSVAGPYEAEAQNG